MRVSVYGSGLTALVTAWALADVGNEVLLWPGRQETLRKLRQLVLGFDEPGLKDRLKEQLITGRLLAAETEKHAFHHGQVHCLAYESNDQHRAETLCERLARQAETPIVLLNQSTFPVGTTERLQHMMQQQRSGESGSVTCLALPSFLQEGAAIQGFTRPQRILLGSDSCGTGADEVGLKRVQELLRPFNRNHERWLRMSTREAEFTKYAINGMLATKLSFMNEMANLADQLQVDIEQVRKGVGSDPRIGSDYIYPGCGFGGLSFSDDVMRLAEAVEERVEDSYLLSTVLQTNQQQKEVLFRKLWQLWQADMQGKTVALWGASFKPGTDRIDNAPSLTLMQALWAQGVRVRLYDPKAMSNVAAWAGERDDLDCCDGLYQALEGADALLIVTEWKEFWSPDFERMAQLMPSRLILDGRNIYDPGYLQAQGFRYIGIGRSNGVEI
ncbi:UDP-glucose dehydrogenase family protein [Motiliproteus sp.]|uniref:UDP-glucose dehydrogenase family protein n=1 Tax=Motiliproteus sp. TaxID=1898955 RepID=UPI003BA84BBB